jgi:hypothetical protein
MQEGNILHVGSIICIAKLATTWLVCQLWSWGWSKWSSINFGTIFLKFHKHFWWNKSLCLTGYIINFCYLLLVTDQGVLPVIWEWCRGWWRYSTSLVTFVDMGVWAWLCSYKNDDRMNIKKTVIRHRFYYVIFLIFEYNYIATVTLRHDSLHQIKLIWKLLWTSTNW